MADRGEFLVGIINNKRDFSIFMEENWYRIPKSSKDKWLKERWPPKWIAIYQTKVFRNEAFSIQYFSKVVGVKLLQRKELFPGQPEDVRDNNFYFQLLLDKIQVLPTPIISQRWRRIIFIKTTLEKFLGANDINDLFDSSPLENKLWTEFKKNQINAERQEFVTVDKNNYFLDFSIYCDKGKINVETDGDTWHSNPKAARTDNIRDNAIEIAGWKVLRFNSKQIQEEISDYCVPSVSKLINNLGGLESPDLLPKKINLQSTHDYQLGLFDKPKEN